MRARIFFATLALLGIGCSAHQENVLKEHFQMEGSALSFNSSERISPEKIQQQAERLNTFSLSLYRELGASDDGAELTNLIISPFSVRSAFSMLYPAAEKNSSIQNEMKEAMSFNNAENELLPEVKSLALKVEDAFARTPSGYLPKYRMVNQVFVDGRLQLFPNFLDTLKTFHNAGVGKLDFRAKPEQSRETINKYIKDKTNSQIYDLLPKGSIQFNTASLLINTIYMLAKWETEFSKDSTQPEPFTNAAGEIKNVDTMVQREDLLYYSDPDFHAVSKPYDGNKVALLTLVPKEGLKISDIETKLTATRFSQLLKDMKSREVIYRLPKFKIEWGTESLKPALKKLGMREIFGVSNCFPRMLNIETCISDVFHKAKISVDETGTEAAAATAIVLAPSSDEMNPTPPIEVKVNRPSVFFIYEKSIGAILFAGRIAEI
ncbi:MAG: hypothetical protein RI953_1663 [Pseudomonadota bacterium]|jgi:serpin B